MINALLFLASLGAIKFDLCKIIKNINFESNVTFS